MRLLIFITVGYIIGIIWGLYLNLSIVPIFFILGGGISLLVRIKYIKIDKIKKYKLCILLFIIFAVISNVEIRYLENRFDNLYKEQEEVKIIGTIVSEKKETQYKANYIIKVESINGDEKYKGTKLIIYTKKDLNLEYGSLQKITGIYEKAKEGTNYKAFDYREYLKEKNIYGIVNIDDETYTLKKNNLNFILIFFNNIKIKIKENLKEILGEESKIAIGILLRRYIRSTRRNYREF